jgi:hypothetical protein
MKAVAAHVEELNGALDINRTMKCRFRPVSEEMPLKRLLYLDVGEHLGNVFAHAAKVWGVQAASVDSYPQGPVRHRNPDAWRRTFSTSRPGG